MQTDDYYPFGLTFNSYSRENTVSQNFQYNGKELQNDLSLDWIDYGARMYMPETGRWGLPDPHAVSYFDWSPYSYVYDNPIFFVDPNGEDVDVSQLLKSSNGFYVLYNLLSSLSNVTGNNIGYKNGKLINNGANKDATGSKSAASYLDRLITSEGTIIVGNDNSRGSDANSGAGRNTINLNSDQIDGFIASTSKAGLGEETQGYGMTFFHESLHTGTGTVEYRRLNGIKDDDTNYSDNWSATEPKGAVENIVNGFRTEMKLPTREAYNSINHTNADGTLLYSTLDFKSNGKIISVNLMNMSSAEQGQRRWAPLNSYIKELFKKNK